MIYDILQKNFTIAHLEITDDTHLHVSHAEFKKTQGAHFSILIVSVDFQGKRPLERHRMIHEPLKEELKASVHALAIKALTPEEFDRA